MARSIKDLDEFVRVHGVLLASAGIPPTLYEQLLHKLRDEVFDGGNFFRIQVCENRRQRCLVLSSEEGLAKHSQVFLVDHAWSFRLTDARTQLSQYPDLVNRLGAMMCVTDEAEEEAEEESQSERDCTNSTVEDIITKEQQKAEEQGQEVSWLELDDMGIDDEKLLSLKLSTNFPKLVGLSLWGNELESKDVILEALAGLKCLKALWINGNPIDIKGGVTVSNAVLSALPQLEILNSKFTDKYDKWAVCFASGVSSERPLIVDSLKNVEVLDLSKRNIRILHPKIFNACEMPALHHLNLRENPLDSDTRSNTLEILCRLPNLQTLEIDVPGPLGNSGLEVLENLPNILELNGVKAAKILESNEFVLAGNLEPRLPEWTSEEPLTERVLKAMWMYVMNYRLCDEEKLDETPIWYIMDELGSALRHSDNANFRVAPFMFMPDGTVHSAISYSLLWPVKDVTKGEECTRDYLFGIGEAKQRSARLTAWFHTPKGYFEKVFHDFAKKPSCTRIKFDSVETPPTQSIYLDHKKPLAVYTDLPQVVETLTRPEFKFCDEPSKADILWTSMQIDDNLRKEFDLRDDQYINQFPFEACIVMKHYLAQTIQQAYGAPPWLQTTYNMETQLAALIGDYFVREKEGRNNLWIVKPWNMARTIDTSITDHLPALIRQMETGPKICQKYVESPALYQGKKFDLRYIVLLRSLWPFEIYLSDVFWARISNHQYTLDKDSFADYETHFTVMNYGRKLVHVNTHDFVSNFEKEHKVNWKNIHQKVRKMIRSVFEGAFAVHPEMHSPKSRAIYGVDVLLDSTFEPKILEVTYCPDCTRACKYDMRNVLGNGEMINCKEFFNDVFGCLFLNTCKNATPL